MEAVEEPDRILMMRPAGSRRPGPRGSRGDVPAAGGARRIAARARTLPAAARRARRRVRRARAPKPSAGARRGCRPSGRASGPASGGAPVRPEAEAGRPGGLAAGAASRSPSASTEAAGAAPAARLPAPRRHRAPLRGQIDRIDVCPTGGAPASSTTRPGKLRSPPSADRLAEGPGAPAAHLPAGRGGLLPRRHAGSPPSRRASRRRSTTTSSAQMPGTACASPGRAGRSAALTSTGPSRTIVDGIRTGRFFQRPAALLRPPALRLRPGLRGRARALGRGQARRPGGAPAAEPGSDRMTRSRPAPGRRSVDAAEREPALQDLDTTFLVEAAAGSGKTTLLLGRIVNLVRRGPGPPAEIAAVTFTEKAAADLRIRLRGELARGRPPRGAPGARDRPDRHHPRFAAGLLRERPVEAGVDPGFTVADPLVALLLRDRTWERWLPEALSDPAWPRPVRQAIQRGLGLERLRELAFALVDARDRLGRPAGARAIRRAAGGPERATPARRSSAGRAMAAARVKDPEDRAAPTLEDLAQWVHQTAALADADPGARRSSGPRAAAGQARAARQPAKWRDKAALEECRAGPDRAARAGGGRPGGCPPQPGRRPCPLGSGLRRRLQTRQGPGGLPRLPRPAPPGAQPRPRPRGRAAGPPARGSGTSWSTSSRTPTRSSSRWSCLLAEGARRGACSSSAIPSRASTGSAGPTSRPTRRPRGRSPGAARS